jgi:lysophosphatidylcholine acyltransferase / lyso-PAF acetyltransferase
MAKAMAPLDTMKTTNENRPFERLDQYGELGLKPQPLSEKLRLLFFAIFLVPFKAIGTLACLLSYFFWIKISPFIFPASVRSDWVASLGKIHCRGCLFSLGFVHITWIKVEADLRPPAIPAVGIVSNHSSWIDILIHMSHSFPSFVARDATKKTPIIGSIRQV